MTTYFITGGLGCIGAWVVKELLERGDRPVVFDPSPRDHRLKLLLEPEQMSEIGRISGDVTDPDQVLTALEESGADKIVHLAGLQVPLCKADPIAGARVNVVGTLNVFEAARTLGVGHLVYASSAAVYGPGRAGEPVKESDVVPPGTHYGVYKSANEGNARVYFADHGISSTGLRPLTVYGPARDFGMTSDPTRALKAALLGRDFNIRFGGATDFIYTADIARAFLSAADQAPQGAHVFNVHGETATLARFVDLADATLPPEARGHIHCSGPELPIAPELDGTAFEAAMGGFEVTGLEAGIAQTVQHFQALAERGQLDPYDLDL